MKHKWLFLVIPLLILFLVIEGFFLKIDLEKIAEKENNPSRLPVMNISLHDTSLEEITSHSKDIKYEGNDLELSFDDTVLNFSNVEIKGRGNSTWSARKKPFQIKFDSKVDLFGFGARKKYILLANAYDDSFIRNALMFKMTEMIKKEYSEVGRFIELYIDDEYQGLYYLTTKVEIGKAAVDLRDKYGILIELDTLHRAYEECIEEIEVECLIVKDAVYEDDEEILTEAVSDFARDFSILVRAAKRGDFRRVSEVIDVESFAEYFLISEFAVNPDAYVSSFYFYKNGKKDKIHAGPMWDYDFAFSNRNWDWNRYDGSFFSPTESLVQRKDVFIEENEDSDTRKFMYYLFDMPEFRAEVERIFRDKLSGRGLELEKWTFELAASIKDAALMDIKYWRDDEELYLKDVKYLLSWLRARFDYFEQEYGREKEWIFRPGVI